MADPIRVFEVFAGTGAFGRAVHAGELTVANHTLQKLTHTQAAKAVELYEHGFSLAEIGGLFGVTRQSMWMFLKRRGVEMRPQLRYGADNHFFRGGPLGDVAAQKKLDKAVRAGRITRPNVCEACGDKERPFRDGRTNIQAHHDDYNKPLEVRWLCRSCHFTWHVKNTPIPKREA